MGVIVAEMDLKTNIGLDTKCKSGYLIIYFHFSIKTLLWVPIRSDLLRRF